MKKNTFNATGQGIVTFASRKIMLAIMMIGVLTMNGWGQCSPGNPPVNPCDLICNGDFGYGDYNVGDPLYSEHQINRGAPWYSPTQLIIETASYCNSPSIDFTTGVGSGNTESSPVIVPQVGVPFNRWGHQNSHVGADGYAEIHVRDDIQMWGHENGQLDRTGYQYISQRLTCPMVYGVTYTISMSSCLAQFADMRAGSMGFVLTHEDPGNPLFYYPALNNQTGLNSGLLTSVATGATVVPTHWWALQNNWDWNDYTFDYTANGTEEYITIGIFSPSFAQAELGELVSYGSESSNFPCSSCVLYCAECDDHYYTDYYIDGVSIVPKTEPIVSISGTNPACTPTGSYTVNGLDGWTITSVELDEAHDGTVTMTSANTFDVAWDFTYAFVDGPETITVNYSLCHCSHPVQIIIYPCCQCEHADGMLVFGDRGGYWNGNQMIYATDAFPSNALNTDLYGTSLHCAGANTAVNITGQTIAIEGAFIVNETMHLDDCNLIMGKDAEIIVNEGKDFWVENSWIHACCQMWEGITVNANAVNGQGSVKLDRVLIEDANHAIKSKNGGKYDCETTIFNKNSIGILVQDNSQQITPTDFNLNNNVFTCRDFSSLSTNFLFTPCVSNGSPSAGISGVLGSEYNAIHFPQSNNWQTQSPPYQSGYYLLNQVINGINYYSTLYPFTTLNLPRLGQRSYAGVVVNEVAEAGVDPNLNSYTPLIIGHPEDGAGSTMANGVQDNGHINTFDYLDYGVISWHSNVSVLNNIFMNINNPGHKDDEVYTAAVFAYQRSFDIASYHLQVGDVNPLANNVKNRNYFFNCNNGVYVQNVNTDIKENRMVHILQHGAYLNGSSFRKSHVTSNSMRDMNWGIETMDMAGTWETVVDHNHIEVNTWVNAPFYRNSFGVGSFNQLPGNTNLLIEANTIQLWNITTANSSAGVRVEYHNKAKVLGNTVDLENPLNDLNDKSYGIWLAVDDGTTCDNNMITNTATNLPTSLDINYGIMVENSTNSHVFENYLTKMSSGIVAQGSCNSSIFGCNTLDHCYHGFHFYNANIADHQLPDSGGGLYPATGNSWIVCGLFDIGGVASPGVNWYEPTGFNINIQLGSNVTLFTNTDQNAACTIPPCCDGMEKSAMREFLLGKIMRGENVYDTLSGEFLLHDSVYAYHTLSKDTSLLNLGTAEDILYQTFYTLCQNENIGSFEHVNFYAIDSLYADIDAAIAENNNISPVGTIEDNQKIVNTVYLQKLKFEHDSATTCDMHFLPDSAQTAQLESVAFQLPVQGGNSVYLARTLLWIDVNDDRNVGKSMTHQQHGVHPDKKYGFRLFPNPSSGNLTLEYKVEENENAVLGIYSTAGVTIKKYTLNSNTTSATIDATQLSAGAYIWGIKVNDKLVKMDKLIIIK